METQSSDYEFELEQIWKRSRKAGGIVVKKRKEKEKFVIGVFYDDPSRSMPSFNELKKIARDITGKRWREVKIVAKIKIKNPKKLRKSLREYLEKRNSSYILKIIKSQDRVRYLNRIIKTGAVSNIDIAFF